MKLYINKKEHEDYTSYYTTCKERDTENKCYLSVQFTKGNAPQTDRVEIKDGFFAAYSSKNGIQPKLVVMAFEDIGTNFDEKETKELQKMTTTTRTKSTDVYEEFGNSVEYDTSDMPF